MIAVLGCIIATPSSLLPALFVEFVRTDFGLFPFVGIEPQGFDKGILSFGPTNQIDFATTPGAERKVFSVFWMVGVRGTLTNGTNGILNHQYETPITDWTMSPVG